MAPLTGFFAAEFDRSDPPDKVFLANCGNSVNKWVNQLENEPPEP
ncbi:MAG TPA: hypothetical protein V6C65_10875 [Allocoleopsis sp.]